MRPWNVAKDGTVKSIQYIDQWSQIEYIDDVEASAIELAANAMDR